MPGLSDFIADIVAFLLAIVVPPIFMYFAAKRIIRKSKKEVDEWHRKK
jgi:preprotein translocase subunit YajC